MCSGCDVFDLFGRLSGGAPRQPASRPARAVPQGPRSSNSQRTQAVKFHTRSCTRQLLSSVRLVSCFFVRRGPGLHDSCIHPRCNKSGSGEFQSASALPAGILQSIDVGYESVVLEFRAEVGNWAERAGPPAGTTFVDVPPEGPSKPIKAALSGTDKQEVEQDRSLSAG